MPPRSVAAKTGDTVGGLLNATLGNLTELIITLTALRAGEYTLVKASVAGAIVANTLFLLGGSFLLGGLRYHLQEYNRVNARLQTTLLFLATVAMLIPSAVSEADSVTTSEFTQTLSVGLAAVLIAVYGLGLVFSFKTHSELFSSAERRRSWRRSVADGAGSGDVGRRHCGARTAQRGVRGIRATCRRGVRDDAGVRGFIVVAIVGGAAEILPAFSAARKNRLDLSVGIGLGSASQIALFVGPVLVLLSYVIGPTPMDLVFWPGAVVMMLIATMTAVLVTNNGRSTWFVGVLMLVVYLIFAMTLYLLPPQIP